MDRSHRAPSEERADRLADVEGGTINATGRGVMTSGWLPCEVLSACPGARRSTPARSAAAPATGRSSLSLAALLPIEEIFCFLYIES